MIGRLMTPSSSLEEDGVQELVQDARSDWIKEYAAQKSYLL